VLSHSEADVGRKSPSPVPGYVVEFTFTDELSRKGQDLSAFVTDPAATKVSYIIEYMTSVDNFAAHLQHALHMIDSFWIKYGA
jgi:hypothetical protein